MKIEQMTTDNGMSAGKITVMQEKVVCHHEKLNASEEWMVAKMDT
jgi:hypothetical protein